MRPLKKRKRSCMITCFDKVFLSIQIQWDHPVATSTCVSLYCSNQTITMTKRNKIAKEHRLRQEHGQGQNPGNINTEEGNKVKSQ